MYSFMSLNISRCMCAMKREVYARRWLCGRYMLVVLDQPCTGELAQRYVLLYIYYYAEAAITLYTNKLYTHTTL